ncbi:MAG: protein-glutamate O-methyltransferase CheR, partial [Betaproteobacteria bacterium]
MKDYEDYLKRDPAEVELLFQDILINVTTFFRDPESFEALAQTVFPKLLAGRKRDEPVRIWTLGCSTGEEAYSLAMVFAECAEAAGSEVPMQLFATDLNSVCVGKARTGVYPASIELQVSPARLQRFFTKEEGGYRICKEIRERCIFSRHNVLADPPFSRIDLISCRNLLIYMEPVLQKQIMALLHYALKPDGHLWLGRSETAGASRALF